MTGPDTNGPDGRAEHDLRTELVDVLRQLIRFGKASGQIVLGGGLFVLAGYVYLNPILLEGGWFLGIGFYELLLLSFGSVLFLIAYRNARRIESA